MFSVQEVYPQETGHIEAEEIADPDALWLRWITEDFLAGELSSVDAFVLAIMTAP